MKYVLEIATEPTLHVAVLIIIVILSSFAFTVIAIGSGDPLRKDFLRYCAQPDLVACSSLPSSVSSKNIHILHQT
jgi:hypothetical protein